MGSQTDVYARGGRLPRSARRAQLLEAAQAVFADSGYHAASMDEIAIRASVSKPVLYQHFPGKLDLYLALIDRHTNEVPRLVQEALAATHDNATRVAAAMSAFFEFVERDDGAFRLVFESDLIDEPAVRQRVRQMDGACAASIAAVIAEDTDLTPQQAQMLGVSLVGMAQVVARDWLHQEPATRMSRTEAERLVIALGWRGLAGFPKTGE
ncbi:TetR/AcrR family transcriptional regulator [Allobranchiibius sp. CTAmp26]|uniref:TetR/AcrR family transcriptional regulator n=1 Tax=Allobranchiibius sp. CTAmp26 TaxID=2815214 RepID=UPI0027DB7B6E|nr:TetR/AcrR family transcriptional regulator [Allobranchiibius sp. CTAmp26]